jgi:hypothetical protein
MAPVIWPAARTASCRVRPCSWRRRSDAGRLGNLTWREPRIVALALLVVIAAGLSAILTIGRQEDPTITNLFATSRRPIRARNLPVSRRL